MVEAVSRFLEWLKRKIVLDSGFAVRSVIYFCIIECLMNDDLLKMYETNTAESKMTAFYILYNVKRYVNRAEG